tara:strand:- start:2851 stop:3159 length:309 start_codon:yes stop_codon:yes gene_type:complete
MNSIGRPNESAAEIAVRTLTRTVGALNFSDRYFADAIRRLHPTMQQKIFDAFLELVYQLSDDFEAGNHDLRNQTACRNAWIMTQALHNKYLREQANDPSAYR